ncbi:unnamed protein product [Caenorhabditis auriculariae]|uniref:Uncharacterized protein n=1 Tax=Caenorhabditis auriculariae TaxID=2777116 RepID=A0A8S1H3E7_9PELO|nr:unnamed protein product [Caenorhabditis auriculariae]
MLELGDGVLQRSHRKNFPHHHLQIEKFVERHVFHFRTICRTGYLPDDILEISELFDMLRVVNEFSAQEESLIRKLIDGPEDCLQFFSYLPEIKSLFNIQIQGDRRFFKKVPQYGASLNTTTNTSFHRSPTPPNNIPLQNLDQRSSSISKASNASFALPEQNMNSTRSSSGQNYQFFASGKILNRLMRM